MNATYTELKSKHDAYKAEMAALELEMKEAHAIERAGMLAKIHKELADWGFTDADLKVPKAKTGKSASNKSKGNVNPPKYVNHLNLEQTWPGVGMTPKWIDKSVNRDDYLIVNVLAALAKQPVDEKTAAA